MVGGIYLVADSSLQLPPAAKRNVHAERRPFIVLSGPEWNRNDGWPLVLGCPLSSQTHWKTALCVKISAGEFGMDRKTWVRVPALQPLEKAQLEDRIGVLDGERLEIVQSRVVEYLGLLDSDEPGTSDEAGDAWGLD